MSISNLLLQLALTCLQLLWSSSGAMVPLLPLSKIKPKSDGSTPLILSKNLQFREALLRSGDPFCFPKYACQNNVILDYIKNKVKNETVCSVSKKKKRKFCLIRSSFKSPYERRFCIFRFTCSHERGKGWNQIDFEQGNISDIVETDMMGAYLL